MQAQTLILTPDIDFNAHAMSWALARAGHQPVWAHSGSLADPALGTLSLECDGHSALWASDGWERGRFTSVWLRWLRSPSRFPGVADADRNFVAREWGCAQDNLLALAGALDGALWVNPPASAERAENKIVQLQAAIQCGLRVPPTLLSNEPKAIRDFLTRHPRAIYKPFRAHCWQDQDGGRIYETPTALIDDPEQLSDAALRLCPGLYQRYVEKRCDIRLIMIGEHFFGARINSRTRGSYVDWRPMDLCTAADVLVSDWQPPAALAERLRELMRRLGLVYGAIDLVIDQDDQAVFLEVNQVGQFLFVEEWLPQHPLLRAMCAMLAQGRCDYELAQVPAISFQEYVCTEEYLQWSAEMRRRQREAPRDPRVSVERSCTA